MSGCGDVTEKSNADPLVPGRLPRSPNQPQPRSTKVAIDQNRIPVHPARTIPQPTSHARADRTNQWVIKLCDK